MSTPTIFANLENLANDCGMHRNTLPKYLSELLKAGLVRFDTPSYWRRKSGYAMEIHFSTKMVEKWLRDNGFLKTMHKNTAWSKSRNADEIYTAYKVRVNRSRKSTGLRASCLHNCLNKSERVQVAAVRWNSIPFCALRFAGRNLSGLEARKWTR
jgi:hypothetical protein